MWIRVNISDPKQGMQIANSIKSLAGVKGVEIKDDTLSEKDWIKPGRPATDEEIEALAKAMDEDDDEGISTQQLKAELHEWINKVIK